MSGRVRHWTCLQRAPTLNLPTFLRTPGRRRFCLSLKKAGRTQEGRGSGPWCPGPIGTTADLMLSELSGNDWATCPSPCRFNSPVRALSVIARSSIADTRSSMKSLTGYTVNRYPEPDAPFDGVRFQESLARVSRRARSTNIVGVASSPKASRMLSAAGRASGTHACGWAMY